MEAQQSLSYDQVFRSQVVHLPQIKAVDTLYYTDEAITLYDNEQTSPFRPKDDLLMIFHLQGQMTSHFGGIEQPFHYKPGSWSFIYSPQENIHPAPAGQLLETVALGIDKAFFTDLIAHEADPWMERLLNRVEQRQPFSLVPDNTPIGARVAHQLSQFRQCRLTGSIKGLYQQSRLFDILTDQLSYIKSQEQVLRPRFRLSRLDSEKLRELKKYLAQNFLKEHTLDGLARISGLNTFKLKTGFKEMFSVSVFEHLRSLRMQYAEAQLKDNGLNVSEIAYQLGYEHAQHFSAAFKKHFGYSPGQLKAFKNIDPN